MTKYLIKIISICAFVVLLPVVIAGVALSAIGSTMFTLDAYVVSLDAEPNTSATYTLSAGVTNDMKDAEADHIQLSYINSTEVTVNLPVLTGYDFMGWLNGDDQTTFDAAARLDTANVGMDSALYTFELKGNDQIVGFVQSKQYTITFTGVDGDDNDLGETYKDRTFRYGDALPTLANPASGDKVFLGWRMAGANDELMNTAKFDKSNVGGEPYILNAVWSDKMTIEYYVHNFANGNDDRFYSVDMNEAQFNSFTFLNKDGEDYKRGLGEGFKFEGWTDENGQPIENAEAIKAKGFTQGGVIKIFMKKSAISYKVTIKNTISSKTEDWTYDVIDGFKGTEPTRAYYTFAGVTYEGTDYMKNGNDFVSASNSKLGDKIVAGNGDINVNAIWECEYDKINVKYTITGDAGDGAQVAVYGKKGETYTQIGETLETNHYFDVDDKTGIKLEDNFFDTLMKFLAGNSGEFESYAVQGEHENYVTVTLASIELLYDQTPGGSVVIQKDQLGDFAKLIGLLTSQGKDGATITVHLKFEAQV